MARHRWPALLCLLAVLACDSPVAESPGPAHALIRVTADDQVVGTGEALTLEVRVVDAGGAPVAGAAVSWSAEGTGSVTPRSVTTGDGVARAEARPGRGELRITASAGDAARRTHFTVHGCSDCPTWQAITLPAGGRAWAGAQIVDGRIWILGGDDGARGTDAMDVFDPATRALTPAGRLPSALGGAAVTALNGRIYVAGGFGLGPTVADGGSRSVLVVDPATGTSTYAAALDVGRFLAAAAALDGRIYVVGGHDGCDWIEGWCPDGPVSSVEVYDPATDRWSAGPPLPAARALAGAAVLDGRLWVAGGTTGDRWWYERTISSVHVLDPATGTWTARAALPVGGPTQLAVANGTLHALVWGPEQPFSRVFAYDAGRDAWTRLRNAPALVAPMVAAVSDRLYILGGFFPSTPGRYERNVSNDVWVLGR